MFSDTLSLRYRCVSSIDVKECILFLAYFKGTTNFLTDLITSTQSKIVLSGGFFL